MVGIYLRTKFCMFKIISLLRFIMIAFPSYVFLSAFRNPIQAFELLFTNTSPPLPFPWAQSKDSGMWTMSGTREHFMRVQPLPNYLCARNFRNGCWTKGEVITPHTLLITLEWFLANHSPNLAWHEIPLLSWSNMISFAIMADGKSIRYGRCACRFAFVPKGDVILEWRDSLG